MSQNKKNIYIFSTAYYPMIGGAEVSVKEITDRIDDYNYILITAKLRKNLSSFEKIGNISVHRIGFGSNFDKFLIPILGFLKLLSLASKNKPDIFWSLMVTYASAPAYVYNIFSGKNIPVVLTLQEGDSEDYIARKKFGFWGVVWSIVLFPFRLFLPANLSEKATNLISLSWILALNRASTVTVISKYLSERALYFGYKGEIEIVPNGVDFKHFSRVFSEKEITDLKTGLNKKEGDIFLITVSRLVEKNAVEDVIRSLKSLPENFIFLVLGEGDKKTSLEFLAKKLEVSGRVKFVGHVDHSELPKYLKVSDVFIRPSLSEGMGNVFIEAFAAELPVIATQVGGISDFLYDPDLNKDKDPTGRAVPVKNPEAIAKQVKAYIDDKEMTARIVENAKKLAKERYDWGRLAEEMKTKVFDKVLIK